MSSSGKKVFVGLSGGVDSAVSAALLKEQGYNVTGVFIRVWQPEFLGCSQEEDERDAKRVAAHLGIPFMTLDAVEEYKTRVVDYLVREYESGRTPNPDIMCNKFVKFGVFFDTARKNGADFVATGHYVTIQKSKIRSQNEHTKLALCMGKDANKDQSYFLWTLTPEHLTHTLFPVGELEKSQVREKARALDLPNAEKKDSQGLCFIGKLDMQEFLGHFIKSEEGNVINEQGGVIGHHPGAVFFTLGQRHGFTITEKTPDDTPYYVIKKNVTENTLTVSHEPKESNALTENILLHNTNWITSSPRKGETFQARLRYRQGLFSVSIKQITDATAELEFYEPQIAPEGQSLVLYKGEECVGP